MKKLIIGMLLISSPLYTAFLGQVEPFSSDLTDAQITHFLETPRTNNLVIFNDASETRLNYHMPWDEEDWLFKSAAVTLALRDTLVDNKCVVLCSKANWLMVQLLVQLWYDFCVNSSGIILNRYIQNFPREIQNRDFSFQRQRDIFEKKIILYQQKIQDITRIYDEINTLSEIGDESEITDALKILSQKLFGVVADTSHVSVQQLFCTYAYFNIICEHDYICKQVNDDFILFIPRHLVNQQDTLMMQDVQLGLNVSTLSHYDYKKLPDLGTRQEVVERAYRLDAVNNLGQKLLEALKTLVLTKRELVKEVAVLKEDVDKAQAVLPFFNIFIDGHGSADQTIAGISINKIKNQSIQEEKEPSTQEEKEPSNPKKLQHSDFERFLRFLNYEMKTKSLTVLSCFPGGKKHLDTFHIKKPFDSSILDQITYPIITIGMSMSSVFLSALHSPISINVDQPVFFTDRMLYAPWKPSITVFDYYFSLLDEVPSRDYEISSNYERAFKLISGFYPEHETFCLQNYIGVKFPHLSWYSAYEFKKHSKQISQIEALTKKEIIFQADPAIEDRLKVILLGANVIPGEIRFENFTIDTLPLFFPVNYFNQNYVIHSMDIVLPDNRDDKLGLYNLFLKFTSMFSLSEPINILIKNLNLSQQYFDVYFFSDLEYVPGHKMSGLMYIDNNDQAWISSWAVDTYSQRVFKNAPLSLFSKDKLLEFITPVELQARDVLEQFPGLENDSFKKIEQVMHNKLKGVMPEIVQKHYEFHAQEEKVLFRVIDVVHSLQSSAV